ncbi:tetratricopeptide (TPR) repeat protein [Parabacteroides sp. PF5-5]|uniref:DUF6377 domain-containing protein n=1 Tax=unclassified Parabacteroides TaxID=2649774 RepID=UPI002476C45C|nr:MULTISPECIES: DUF6377 domain-containing protein [unclassified Parabacteroides]MDH6304579.1 tetratricopeptide (TPR) repeat protein [Parabacteroides sp. PH5-39]MDH6315808.1 tetratricopeptide (TPR) repeat protein [Parabacteroides sp. PF5-13]MDH6319467.1 tetratricopeptide (TPR) repeat protein [Parabacteroides sp. PH5-13]MDH6323198.1 tetratricopeptide (TPR) repeat protein [Parabacteroides sp. PH5-8]MDH6327000.1 tetratricopeptide (TPR) repeat protein [Parabacteroides sp. PH5-41]
MRITCIIILLFYILNAQAAQPVDTLLAELDHYIYLNDSYTEEKEQKIADIKKNLDQPFSTQDNLFETYIQLFDEYKSYKYDSAYSYANRSLEIALQVKNPVYKIKSNEALVFCFLSSGLFKEAFDMMSSTDVSTASTAIKREHYNLWARLYYDIADYNNEDPFRSEYIAKGNLYSDSVLHIQSMQDIDWWYAYGLQQLKKENYQRAIEAFTTLINIKDIDDHLYAITASTMGHAYSAVGNREQSKICLIQAAIGDIKSVTKETTALRNLAVLLYEDGDIQRANKYIKLALDDANFYNARHRKLEIGSILPIIEQERFEAVEKQRNVLILSVISISLLFVLLLVATVIIYKQIKRVRKARKTIGEQNEQLILTNNQLTEVSNIKDEYIGYSFYMNSGYIDKLEGLYKLVNRKIAARQYEDLRSSFKESDLQKERKNMYSSFDETFLKLFPSFIQAYNNLFQPDDRVIPENSKSLTAEMRIFALIRLGIYESERIAQFLNYSVNTINTYKTKVKNKSIVPNEQFEQKIMEIRSGKQ